VKHPIRLGIRSAQLGLLANTVLTGVKLVAGIVGNSGALIADAVESMADIVSSIIVWSGLRVSAREADESYPFGYGKAEPLAAAVVALLMVGAAAGIAIEAVDQIITPHLTPAPFTLLVLVGVVLTKEVLFRRTRAVGAVTESTAVHADAWHHRSDAITSAAAFVGISISLWKGPGWEAADDWAALLASLIIAANGARILRPAVHDLMDRSPEQQILERIEKAALGVPRVLSIEKLKVRRAGVGVYVDVHVQADPGMSLHDAHELSGRVKGAVRAAQRGVLGVLVHMEPYEDLAAPQEGGASEATSG
jgi:cation diffusion facilitator family transporter